MNHKRNNAEWKKILAPDVYRVTREGGTELAFSGKYDKFFEPGIYLCSNCKSMLFVSEDKFDSGTGWPSFCKTATDENVNLLIEKGNMLRPDRVEVKCASCDAHLGHVFKDGPKPTGLRYCMNSLALEFQPHKEG